MASTNADDSGSAASPGDAPTVGARASRRRLAGGAAIVAVVAIVAAVLVSRGGDDDPTGSMAADVRPDTTAATTDATAPDDEPVGAVQSTFDGPVDPADHLEPRDIPESTAEEPSGNFRTICLPSHLGHDDPILFPGVAGASHLHLFYGNDAVTADSTFESLRSTGGSTCEGGPLNRTGYWMPAMFDGDGDVVPPNLIVVYYKSSASGGSLAAQQADVRDVAELPAGLRMIAGAPGEEIEWKCTDGSGVGRSIPASCPEGTSLEGSVWFPDCWDGVNLDSEDHRSHMSYKVRNPGSGVLSCPSTHPVSIPQITQNAFWDDAHDVGTWTLSSDGSDAPGSSFHADWFGAWEPEVQTRWHQECLVGMRNANNGNLCDGEGLVEAAGGLGVERISGWTPLRDADS